MALPIRVLRAMVGVVKESTPYTFLEPANTDSFHAVNIAYNPQQAKYVRKDSSFHFGKRPDIPGAAEQDISFEIPLVGGAAAANPFLDSCMLGTGHQRGQGVSSTAPTTWAISTVYTAGTIVRTGANNLYVCNSPGTSLGSGTGPAGTTPGVVSADNTVSWMFIGKQVVAWAATTAYVANALVTSGGFLYGCAAAGTSSTVTPSSLANATQLGASIVDGTVTWNFLGVANAGAFGSIFYKPTTAYDNSITSTMGVVWTNPGEVYSAAMWDDGTSRAALSGGQGDFGFSSKQGEPFVGKFKFHGAYVNYADDTGPTGTVVDSILSPPVLLGAGISIFGNAALAFDGFEFSKGNVLSKRADSNQSVGVRGAWVTDHNPMIKVSPEMIRVATLDIAGNWRSGALGAFTTGLVGSGAGNRVQFIAPQCQFGDWNPGEREGARTAELSMPIKTLGNSISGDDYMLAFI